MDLIHAHKTGFLYLVGVCLEVGGKYPYHFYRGETPGDNLKLRSSHSYFMVTKQQQVIAIVQMG